MICVGATIAGPEPTWQSQNENNAESRDALRHVTVTILQPNFRRVEQL